MSPSNKKIHVYNNDVILFECEITLFGPPTDLILYYGSVAETNKNVNPFSNTRRSVQGGVIGVLLLLN